MIGRARTAASIETVIAEVAARCLPPGLTIDADTSFDLLGLDSLAAIELAAALETELGCRVPAELFAAGTSTRGLAARLAGESHQAPTFDDPCDRMVADAALPADVVPPPRAGRSTDLRDARCILLTGATGFLGRALIAELLATTTAALVCLVRTPLSAATTNPRIRVVKGDLSHPRLGLSERAFAALGSEIDAICHCGAAVNWVFSYEALKAANVHGTLDLLRLACIDGVPFHFVSSMSVCYSADGPAEVDESFDALPHLRGVHLGYAHSKVVAEALVRQAGDRGLPVRIYRPGLISGHSSTGAFNRDDLISTLVRGCVAMKAAPDLDWQLDSLPVDVVARQIVALSGQQGVTFHLAHQQPRHWRECVLWMRMSGYDIRLVSYPAWLRQLDRETHPRREEAAAHPLRPLRSFFLDRPPAARGLTRPELYEEKRRTHACDGRTSRLVQHVACPPLDAGLLGLYFEAFRASGDLPEPTLYSPVAMDDGESTQEPAARIQISDPAFVSALLGRPVTCVELLSSGSAHSIVSELTAWRSRRPSGLFQARVTLSGETAPLDVMLKVKAQDTDVIAVGEALAGLVDPVVGAEYRKFSDRLGFTACHSREIAIYQQQDERFRRHTPAVLATRADEKSQSWIAVLERIDDASLIDSADYPDRWQSQQIAAAVDGLATLHAIWLGRETELTAAPWIGYVQSAARMAEMTSLWTALAASAAPLFAAWADPELPRIHRRLATTADVWWRPMETGSRTLIHHDFNPRNVCLRGKDSTLCAYDWELATLGVPQRDLAEFLCFVLPPDATAAQLLHWVEHHRAAVQRESGVSIDPAAWRDGFRSSLYDLLVNRLSVYTMVHRIRPQSFLPRVLRSWRNIYTHFPLDGSQ